MKNLISDFHQNKDWNLASTGRILCFPYLISDFHQNKDWNYRRVVRRRRKAGFDFWFPPKQGLKPARIWKAFCWFQKFDFWFPPKQGLKRVEEFYLPTFFCKFDFWFPPKQGLKRSGTELLWCLLWIWFLISTKTRIETVFYCIQ